MKVEELNEIQLDVLKYKLFGYYEMFVKNEEPDSDVFISLSEEQKEKLNAIEHYEDISMDFLKEVFADNDFDPLSLTPEFDINLEDNPHCDDM